MDKPDRTESGGMGFAHLLMGGSIGAGAYMTARNITRAGDHKAAARVVSGSLNTQSEAGRKVVRDLINEVQANKGTLTDTDIDKFFQKLLSSIEKAPEAKQEVMQAWKAALWQAGPAYKNEYASLSKKVSEAGLPMEGIIDRMRGILVNRTSLTETPNFLKLFGQNIKNIHGRPMDLVSPTGQFQAGRIARFGNAQQLLQQYREAPGMFANMSQKYGNAFALAGASGAGETPTSIQFVIRGQELEIPLSYGPNQGLVSTGMAAQNRYITGRFMPYSANAPMFKKSLSFTEYSMWRLEQEIMPKVINSNMPIKEVRSTLKRFQQELQQAAREFTPGIDPAIAGPNAYIRHRAGYVSRFDTTPKGLIPRSIPEQLGGAISYGGVSKEAASKGIVSTIPTEAIVPFGWNYSEGGVEKAYWGVSQRPEMMIRDWSPTTAAIEAAQSYNGAPRQLTGALVPDLFTKSAAAPPPLISTAFIDYDKLNRTRRWVSNGAGLMAGDKLTRQLMQKTAVKTETILGDIPRQLDSLLKGANEAEIGNLTLAEGEVLGVSAKTQEFFSLPQGATPLTIKRVPYKEAGTGLTIQAHSITYEWTPEIGRGSHKIFYGGRDIARIATGTAGAFETVAPKMEAELGVLGRTPEASIRGAQFMASMNELKKNRSLANFSMFQQLWEMEASMMNRAGKSSQAINEEYGGLYSKFFTEKTSPANVEQALIERAKGLGLTSAEAGTVFGAARWGSLGGGVEAATAQLQEWGFGARKAQGWAEQITNTPYVRGFIMAASKGPVSELGAGELASFEPRGIFTLAAGGPAEQGLLGEVLAARRLGGGAESLAATRELGETIGSLMGMGGKRNVPTIPIGQIPEGAGELGDFIGRQGSGFYIGLNKPIEAEFGTISKMYVPGAEAMGTMLEAQQVGKGTIPGYMAGQFSETINLLRGGDVAAINEKMPGMIGREWATAWGSTVLGLGSGSNITGAARGKLPYGAQLVGTSIAATPPGWGAETVGISEGRAAALVEQMSRYSAEEAQAMETGLAGEGWKMGVWRHPFVHPGSVQVRNVRVNPNLMNNEVQLIEEMWTLSAERHNLKLTTALDPAAAMFGDYDADLYHLFPISKRGQARGVTDIAMVQEQAARAAMLKDAFRGGAGAAPNIPIGEMERLEALGGYLEKTMTGQLSTSLTKMRVGIEEAVKAGTMTAGEAESGLGVLGQLEQLPISARHYDISQMDKMVKEAEILGGTLKGATSKDVPAIAEYLRSAAQEGTAGRAILEGRTVEAMGTQVGTGATKKISVGGWNLEEILGKTIEATQASSAQAADIRNLSSKYGTMNLNRVKQLLTGQAQLTAVPGLEALAVMPESRGTMAGVVGKIAAGQRSIAAAGGRLIAHAAPLAYGFAGALAIGSFFSSPRASLPAGANRPPNARPARRSGTESPLALPQTNMGVMGDPSPPRGIPAASKTYLQKARRSMDNSWKADIRLRPKSDIDANMLAGEISAATQNRANVNVSVRNWRNKLTQRQTEDMLFGT